MGFICEKEQRFDFDACITAVVNCVRPGAGGELDYGANPIAGREGGVLSGAFRGARPSTLAGAYDCALPPRSHPERSLAVRARASGPDLSAGRFDSGNCSTRKAGQMVTVLVRPEEL